MVNFLSKTEIENIVFDDLIRKENMFKKVLFTQFSIPSLDPLEYKSNVQLASGYLIGFVRNLFPSIEFITTPRIYTDLLNENAYIRYAQNIQPDLLVFSLYLWNIKKTLRIAAKLKKMLPEVKIIFGGPEVNNDNEYLKNHHIFDFGISGEGEKAFASFLSGTDFSRIPSFLTKNTFNNFCKHRKKFLSDENPYLSNLIETKPDNTLYFETVRGCPFSCNFCYYNKVYSKIIQVNKENLNIHFRYAIENDFDELFLLDPSFNVQPGFDSILDKLIHLNNGPKFKISTEIRADFLNNQQIEKLVKLNIQEVEIGLQTTNPIALKNMNRADNTGKTIQNTQKLIKAGIDCKVDLIVGLPGDNLENFKKSVDDVFKANIYQMAQVFRLSILSGTEFSINRSKYSIFSDPEPPYYLFSTKTFNETDIFKALEYANEAFDLEVYSLPAYHLSRDFSDLQQSDFVQFDADINAINKIIFKKYVFNPKKYEDLFCENLVLHFTNIVNSENKSKIVKILQYFKNEFPFNSYQLIFHFEKSPDIAFLYEIIKFFPLIKSNYLNKDAEAHLGKGAVVSLRVAVILPVSYCYQKNLRDLFEDFDVFWEIKRFDKSLIEDLYEENNLFFSGEEQELCYSFLEEKEMLDDFTSFDSYFWEKKKNDKNADGRKYYPHTLEDLS